MARPNRGRSALPVWRPGRCIWAEALEGPPDQLGQGPEILSPGATVARPAPATAGAPQAERRSFSRYKCSGGVQLRKEATDLPTWAKLADISLGGCYAELLSPLPLQTLVEFAIHADDLEIRGRGVVRTAHPSVGNGISFTQMKADDWRRLNQLIARLASPTPRDPSPAAVHSVEPGIAQPLEVLLELLQRKGVFTRDEFLTELRIKSRLERGPRNQPRSRRESLPAPANEGEADAQRLNTAPCYSLYREILPFRGLIPVVSGSFPPATSTFVA